MFRNLTLTFLVILLCSPVFAGEPAGRLSDTRTTPTVSEKDGRFLEDVAQPAYGALAKEFVQTEAMGTFAAVHLYTAMCFPPEFTTLIWHHSREMDIDPYDLAGYVISEHSHRIKDFSFLTSVQRDCKHIDFESDALNKTGGEQGIAQLKPGWVFKARRDCKKEGWPRGDCASMAKGEVEQYEVTVLVKDKDGEPILDWKGNFQYETKKYWRAIHGDDGLFDPAINLRVAAYVLREAHVSHEKELATGVKVHHEWHAHLKTGTDHRDVMCGQSGFKKRKMKKVLSSIRSLTRPLRVWEETKREYRKYCLDLGG